MFLNRKKLFSYNRAIGKIFRDMFLTNSKIIHYAIPPKTIPECNVPHLKWLNISERLGEVTCENCRRTLTYKTVVNNIINSK